MAVSNDPTVIEGSGNVFADLGFSDAEELLAKAGLAANIMIDCSHANSSKDPDVQPLVLKDVTHQVLEGNESSVDEMMTLIEKDDRHRDVRVLGEVSICDRYFASCSMGFASVPSMDDESPAKWSRMKALDFIAAGMSPLTPDQAISDRALL